MADYIITGPYAHISKGMSLLLPLSCLWYVWYKLVYIYCSVVHVDVLRVSITLTLLHIIIPRDSVQLLEQQIQET